MATSLGDQSSARPPTDAEEAEEVEDVEDVDKVGRPDAAADVGQAGEACHLDLHAELEISLREILRELDVPRATIEQVGETKRPALLVAPPEASRAPRSPPRRTSLPAPSLDPPRRQSYSDLHTCLRPLSIRHAARPRLESHPRPHPHPHPSSAEQALTLPRPELLRLLSRLQLPSEADEHGLFGLLPLLEARLRDDQRRVAGVLTLWRYVGGAPRRRRLVAAVRAAAERHVEEQVRSPSALAPEHNYASTPLSPCRRHPHACRSRGSRPSSACTRCRRPRRAGASTRGRRRQGCSRSCGWRRKGEATHRGPRAWGGRAQAHALGWHCSTRRAPPSCPTREERSPQTSERRGAPRYQTS